MNPKYIACYWSNRHWNCLDDMSLNNANKKALEMYGTKYDSMELHPNQMPVTNKKVLLYHPKYCYEYIKLDL